MSRSLKGINIQIGAETRGLDKALGDVNKRARDTQSELRHVDRLLKLDPKNTELVAQKQKLLGNSINATKDKLKQLKGAQSQVEQQFKTGKIGEEQYRAFRREIVKTEGQLKQLEGRGKKTNALMSGGAKNIAAAWTKVAVGAVAAVAAARGFWDFIKAGEADITAEARIRNIAHSMRVFGEQADIVTDRLVELAGEQARLVGVDDDVIQMAQAKLLTFKELAKTADEMGGAFDRATTLTLDLAAAGFGTAEGNAVQLGKAMNDPIKGLASLSRAGIQFTDVEKSKIRVLVESNRMLEAQEVILKAIETQVGGTAAATANATDRLAVASDQLKEGAAKSAIALLGLEVSMLRLTQLFGHAADGEWKEFLWATDEEVAALNELANKTKDAEKAGKAHVGTTKDQTDATEDAADATDKLTRSLKGELVALDSLQAKKRGAKDAELDWREAVLAAKDAQEEVTRLRKEGKQGTDEYEKAVIALERAELRLADASNIAKEEQLEAARTYVRSKTGVENLSAGQDKLAQKLAKASDRVQRLKAKLETVPKEKRTEVEAKIDKAEKAVERIKGKLKNIPDETVTIKVKVDAENHKLIVNGKPMSMFVRSSPDTELAAGGSFSKPTYALIGETYEKEYVINADRLKRGDARQRALLAGLLKDSGSTGSRAPAGVARGGAGSTTVRIQNVNLPNVTDAQSFVGELSQLGHELSIAR